MWSGGECGCGACVCVCVGSRGGMEGTVLDSSTCSGCFALGHLDSSENKLVVRMR